MPTFVKAYSRRSKGKIVSVRASVRQKSAKQINEQIYRIRQMAFNRVTGKGSARRIAQIDKVRHKLFNDKRYWGI